MNKEYRIIKRGNKYIPQSRGIILRWWSDMEEYLYMGECTAEFDTLLEAAEFIKESSGMAVDECVWP